MLENILKAIRGRFVVLNVYMSEEKKGATVGVTEERKLTGDDSRDGVSIIVEGVNHLFATGHDPERVAVLLKQMSEDILEDSDQITGENILSFPSKPPPDRTEH